MTPLGHPHLVRTHRLVSKRPICSSLQNPGREVLLFHAPFLRKNIVSLGFILSTFATVVHEYKALNRLSVTASDWRGRRNVPPGEVLD